MLSKILKNSFKATHPSIITAIYPRFLTLNHNYLPKGGSSLGKEF